MGRAASRSSRVAAPLLALTLRAHGQEQVAAQSQLPLELDWDAPAECPSSAEVRAEVERIARVGPGYTLTPLVASARVERKAGHYGVELKTEHEGQRGQRGLSAADCRTLVRTVTLVLALAFGEGVEVEEGMGSGTGTGTAAEHEYTSTSTSTGTGTGTGTGSELDSETRNR